MAPPEHLRDRTVALALRTLNRVAASDVLDRLGVREEANRLLRDVSRGGARTATRAGRTFTAAQRLATPARQPRRPRAQFDLVPDDEQRMLRDSVGEFATERLRPRARDADAACATPPELLAQADELGLTMVGVPEALGGAVPERSATTTALMAQALARGDMGMAAACLAPAAVSTAISLWGDAEQQARYLPPFLSDDVPAAALALMEPGALFDPFTLATRAQPAGDGGFALTGVKALVPRAAEAELFVVGAEVPGEGPALFLVPSGLPGLTVEADPALGARAVAAGRLHLGDVVLDAAARLGAGAEVYRDCVALARLAWCALAVGTGEAVLDYVAEYVNGRTAFGEPISHRQAVAFTVADIGIELEGMRLTTLRAASRVDQGLPFHREAALARRLVTERGMRIGSDGVQMLGGHGYTKEHPVERWYRDLRVAGVMEGGLLL